MKEHVREKQSSLEVHSTPLGCACEPKHTHSPLEAKLCLKILADCDAKESIISNVCLTEGRT